MSDGKVVIDTSLATDGFEKGIKSLSGIASIGLKGTVTAIGVVGSALTGLAGAGLKIGADFEEAMSRVQAVSGASTDELKSLTDKAIQMGADTRYTAKESADAMYYMAQAGWKTADMLNGINGVMNLAAASGADLATTSDIVTTSLSAFGLQASDSAHFADVLARASADSQTDVLQMGESFKYVGSIAGAMKYSIEDTSVALELMANSGIKASMAGTSLRSIITRMAKPTSDSAEAMKKLGITISNQDGSMKSLNDVMTELRKGFSGLTEDQKVAYAGMLAGKPAMSGLLAIVNASDDSFNNLRNSIKDCNGSAEDMATIMQDNLKGQAEQLKGSLETLAIKFYQSVDNPLKDITKSAKDMVNALTDAFEKNGFNGMIEELGNLLSEVAINMAKQAPQFIDVSVQVINNLVDGLEEHSDELSIASVSILTSLVNGVTSILPNVAELGTELISKMMEGVFDYDTGQDTKRLLNNLFNEVKNSVENIASIAGKVLPPLVKILANVSDNLNTLIPLVVAGYTAFKAWSIITVVSKAMEGYTVATKLAITAQLAFEAVMKTNPILLVAGAVATLISFLGAYALTMDSQKTKENELAEAVNNRAKAYADVQAKQKETIDSGLTEMDNIQNLSDELKRLVDANGNVKKSDEGRVDFILNQLNKALDQEYQRTGDQIKNYKDMVGSIDTLISKKKGMIILDAEEASYKDATLNVQKASIEASQAQIDMSNAATEAEVANSKYQQAIESGASEATIGYYKTQASAASDSYNQKKSTWEQANATYHGYLDTIKNYDNDYQLFQSGQTDKLIQSYNDRVTGLKKAGQATTEELQNQKILLKQTYDNMLTDFNKGVGGITQESLNQAKKLADDADTEWRKSAGLIVDDSVDAINSKSPNLAAAVKNSIDVALGRASSTATVGGASIGRDFINSVINGSNATSPNLNSTTSSIMDGASNTASSKNGSFYNNGSNFIQNTINGANSQSGNLSNTTSSITGGAVSSASNAGSGTSGIGYNIISGIINGANGQSWSLSSTLISVVSGGLNAVKNFLDIHSPSRVFRDVVGANIVKGVSVGIELESPNMNKQLEDSFKSLSSVKISGLVSKLKTSVNSQMAITAGAVSGTTNFYNKNVNKSGDVLNGLCNGIADLCNTIKKNPTIVEVEGREVARAVAPYQNEFTDYYKGR